jgi:hypothetical protein
MRLIRFAFVVLALAVLFAVGWWLGRPGPPSQVLAGVRVELPLKCYPVLPDPPPPNPGEDIGVSTQFGGSGPTVMEAKLLCAPAVKERKDDAEPVKTMRGDHLHCYQIDGEAAPGRVIVSTQFHGPRPIALGPAVYLCEPTDKDRAR